MKLTVNLARFVKVLSTVSVAVGQKSPTPAFLNFKFEMTEGGLVILGSNNDLTIQSALPIEEDDKVIISDYTCGTALIPADRLMGIVRSLDEDTVQIEVIDDVIIHISNSKSNFQLNSMKAEEYPDLDLSAVGEDVVFKAEDFKKIVAQTTFAASTKEVRPILTAVNVHADGENAKFVATDSYRLAQKTVAMNSHPFDANIPVKALNEVAKLLEGEDIILNISNNKVVFEFGMTKVYSRLISGDFPKTSRMIPNAFPYVLTVNGAKFIESIRRVSLLAAEREKIVKLSLSDEGVEISTKSEQVGSSNERISLYQYEGGRFDISFNVDYVADAIKAVQTEDVCLSFAGEMNAFRATAVGDDSIIQIITPVRNYY